MTSNLGSELIHEKFKNVELNGIEETIEETKKAMDLLLRQTIRPEFLNRVDDIVLFTPLSKKDIREIVEIQFDLLERKLETKGIQLYIKDEAIDHIVQTGFDPSFGARPIKRLIQREILNEFSKAILAGNVDKEKTVVIDVFDGKIIFRKPIAEFEEKALNKEN